MNPSSNRPGDPARALSLILKGSLLPALFLLTTLDSWGGSATWKSDAPYTGWVYSRDWTPESVPNSPDDVATFDFSEQTSIYTLTTIQVDSVVFNAGASQFAISVDEGDFSVSGAGMINHSGVTQSFSVRDVPPDFSGGFPYVLSFHNSATAGDMMELSTKAGVGDDEFGGQICFFDSSTAGSAAIDNLGGSHNYSGGNTYFEDDSSAGDATITNSGSSAYGAEGRVTFEDNATASHATIINNGALTSEGHGGWVKFNKPADSGDSTIICNGDTVGSDDPPYVSFSGGFGGGTLGGRARIVLHGNGELKIDGGAYMVAATVGSIEGDGQVILGEFKPASLSVGSNDLNTTFSGVIQDSKFTTGSVFRKVGRGTLTLAGASTYDGHTVIVSGALKVENQAGSATGPGPVEVRGGALGGRGTIAGAVTVGNGTGRTAVVSPSLGKMEAATLTIESPLTFDSDGIYQYKLSSTHRNADAIAANGLTIATGAQFTATDVGGDILPVGFTLTAISNTSATPISGAFANLAEGALLAISPNTFQVSYHGGDGNDLTLTVVP